MISISPIIVMTLTTTAPNSAELDRLWKTLSDPDPKIAYVALYELVDRADEAVPMIREKLPPARGAETAQLEALFRGLSSSSFRAREAATTKLIAMGADAEMAIKRWSEQEDLSAEMKSRLALISRYASDQTSTTRLHQRRAIQVLEYAGTSAAKETLRGLSQGEEHAWLTEQAQAALDRLERRTAPKP